MHPQSINHIAINAWPSVMVGRTARANAEVTQRIAPAVLANEKIRIDTGISFDMKSSSAKFEG
jgi:hypothetical protein